MGKIVGKAWKGFRNISKGIRKIGDKFIPKGIRNLHNRIKKGVQRVGKGIMKGISKLGPIGTIALSFILPGIGSALGALWASATGAVSSAVGAMAASGNAFISAIGQGLQWAGNAASTLGSAIKTGYQTITGKIQAGLEHIGGSISEGASKLWEGATNVLNGGKPVADMGKAVGEAAMSNTASSTATSAISGPAGFQEAANIAGVKATTATPVIPVPSFGGPAQAQETANITGAKPSTTASQSSISGPAEFQEQANIKGVKATTGGPAKTSFLDTARDMAENFSNALGEPLSAAGGMGMGSYDPSMGATRRGGVGGIGAAGGTFLSEAQRMQQQILENQMRQLG